MHEISICQGILRTLESEFPEEQHKNIRVVFVKIGMLSCVDAPTLEHVFGFVAADGPFKNVRLQTDLVSVKAKCENCGHQFEVENYKFVCPICSNPVSDIIEGKELTIYKISLEEPQYAEAHQ